MPESPDESHVLEGELLPAVRPPAPIEGELFAADGTPVTRARDPEPHELTHKHGICHRLVRESFPPWRALCGHIVHSLAETRRQDLPKCPSCLAASTDHALHCECFKLFPNARLPR